MPSGWNTTLDNLKANLDLAHGSNGLGGITAGAAVVASQFDKLNLAVSDLSTIVGNLRSGTWLTNDDVAVGAAIDKTKISGTAVTLADSGTVSSTMLANSSVTSAKIVDGTIVAGDLASGAVTTAKFGTIPACRLYKTGDTVVPIS